MKKKTGFVAIVCMMLLATQGCGFEEQVEIFPDGSSQVTAHTYSTEEEENALLKELGSANASFPAMMAMSGFVYEGEKEINNKMHHKYTHTEKLGADETSSQFVVKNGDKAVLDYAALNPLAEAQGAAGNLETLDFGKVSIKFPNTVVNANVEAEADTIKMDLSSKFSGDRIYATFKEGVAEKKDLTVTGASNNKYYKKNVIIKAKSSGVITQFRVNNKPQEKDSYTATTDGVYNVNIKLASGVTKTVKFTVDKTKPTTNVKAKTYKKSVKITFKDKGSGMKTATLNKKKIKSGKTVTKAGSYTLVLKDKAGNAKTIKFKIRK
ncbi:MAG: hypothetical protein K2N51_16140 [Lachnospiraceae bacterium]|nr:hypothetical protein [Lachnospiraceae bacterium]